MLTKRHGTRDWEHALAQGLKGHHPLFEPALVRFTMGRRDAPELSLRSQEQLRSVMEAIEGSDDPIEGRAWVQAAPLEVQEILIRAYFESLFDYLDTQPFLAN